MRRRRLANVLWDVWFIIQLVVYIALHVAVLAFDFWNMWYMFSTWPE